MTFATKEWKNAPDTSTPLSAEALVDLETRVAAYGDSAAAAAVKTEKERAEAAEAERSKPSEIAALDQTGESESEAAVWSAKGSAKRVAAEKKRAEEAEAAVKAEISASTVLQPQLVLPDIVGRSASVNAAGAMTEKRLTLLRTTILKSGHLRDLAAYVGTKSGKFILAVYDTGEAKPGYYTRLAWKELEPAEATRWQVAGDPNLAVTAGQQVMFGIVANNAVLTIGRGGGGAAAASSGQLPTSFLVTGGGNLPKLAGYLTAASFEAPPEIKEESLESLGGPTPIPYVLAARIS